MRICLALNSYEDAWYSRFVLALVERVIEDPALEFSSVAISRGGPLEDRFRRLGVRTEVLGARGRVMWRRLRDWARRVKQDPRPPQVIHSHHLLADVAMRVVVRELRPIPLVATQHGMSPLEYKNPLQRFCYGLAERVTRPAVSAWIAPSRHTREVMEQGGYPSSRLHVIPDGADAVQSFPLGQHNRRRMRELLNIQPGELVIGSLGTLFRSRGHDVLIQALPAILKAVPQTRVVIVGDEGPERCHLLEQANRLGVADRITLIGPMAAMSGPLLSSLDLVIQPSRNDVLGVQLAEALACATPVVATHVGALPEIIRDGETGLLVPPDDAESLANGVIRLLSDGELRQKVGAAGREFVTQEYELGQTADAYVELWKSFAGSEEAGERVKSEE